MKNTMNSLILLVVCLVAICIVLGKIPSMSSIKVILIFVIGFLGVYAGYKIWRDMDDL